MIRSNEVRKDDAQIHFSLAALGETRLQPRVLARDRTRGMAVAAVAPQEVNLDGMRVLVGLAFGVCMVGLFMWGFIRHWLFAQ